MFGLNFPVPIMFVRVVPMSQVNPAERLLDEGRLIEHAESTGCQRANEAVAEMSPQKREMIELAVHARDEHPNLMFMAMMEGWSVDKIRSEINKRQ